MPTLGDIIERVTSVAPVEVSTYLAGDLMTVRAWVVSRWKSALNRWPWSFLQKEASFNTVALQSRYPLAPDFWRPWSFRCHDSAGPLVRKPSDWIDRIDPNRDLAGIPRVYTIWQGKQVEFWPTPDGVYTISYRYLYMPVEPDTYDDDMLFRSGEFLVYGALADACAYLSGTSKGTGLAERIAAYEAAYERLLQEEMSLDRSLVVLPFGPDEPEDEFGVIYPYPYRTPV